MGIKTDVIIFFLKLLAMSILSFYSLNKIMNNNQFSKKITIKILVINIFLVLISTFINIFINSLVSAMFLCFGSGALWGIIMKYKIGHSMLATIISYAICLIFYTVSIMLEFSIYKVFKIENNYINLGIILIMQYVFTYTFFKLKKFKNGFRFFDNKSNSELTDIIMFSISLALILITCLLSSLFGVSDEARKNLFITLIVFAFAVIIVIQKTFQMYYKQKLLDNTMKEYEKEIKEKDEKIKELNEEKFNVSKITHKFYNRQKALELLVKETSLMKAETSDEIVSKNVLDMVNELTKEYSEEYEAIKKLSKLPKTDIAEIDSMFRYMQSECNKNNIEFKLKVIGNIHQLINNIISINKLETLIGDHLRDAINAVKSSNNENKEILTILGVKNDKFELSIYDTGVEFRIDTLEKIGQEAVTTYKGKGGSGIGFLTTFETMKETKASLIIDEQKPKSYYTKSVTIRFDGKNEFKICSYRANQIKEKCKNNRIIIEEK